MAHDPLRRIDIEKMTAEELAVDDVIRKVEALGAHPQLTKAVTLLLDAKSAVADFVDKV